MEAGFILAVVFMAVVCVGVGFWIGKNECKPKETKGALNVIYDDQTNEPFLYLESYVPVTEIATQKSVILDVKILR